MQGSLPIQSYVFGDYQLEITSINPRTLSISVIDCRNFKEYYSEALQLKQIGVNTLVKALQRSRLEIYIQISHHGEALRICVKVTSLFLLPIQEEIMIGNERQVNPTQIVKRRIKQLNGKAEAVLKEQVKLPLYFGYSPARTQASQEDYTTIVSVQVTPGNYLLTLSFFVKGTGQWVPLYLYEGELFITNSGFYLPQAHSDCFVPITLRKRMMAFSEKQLCITTCRHGGYSCTFKNAIVVARRIQES